METLNIGDLFDTKFEKGCKVVSLPDEFGYFDALDSDGVQCQFEIMMVENLRKTYVIPAEIQALITDGLVVEETDEHNYPAGPAFIHYDGVDGDPALGLHINHGNNNKLIYVVMIGTDGRDHVTFDNPVSAVEFFRGILDGSVRPRDM